SCASLVLRCQRRADHWSRAAANIQTGASTLEGFEVQGEVTRSRVLSQPADSARWQTHTPYSTRRTGLFPFPLPSSGDARCLPHVYSFRLLPRRPSSAFTRPFAP